MKKLLPIIVVLLIAIGGGGYVLFKKSDDKNTGNQNSQQSQNNNSESSKENKTANESKLYDPCTLFAYEDFARIWSLAEVKQTKVDKELKNSDHTVNSCNFEQANDGSVAGMSNAYNFVVSVLKFDSADAAKARFNADKDSIAQLSSRRNELESTTQVGDGTYFNVAASGEIVIKTESYIVVLKGNHIIEVSSVRIDGVDQTQNRQNLITLTKAKL
ncbi:MAG: hypothetical protein AAB459_03025 [Patescibacteria group bacterium]